MQGNRPLRQIASQSLVLQLPGRIDAHGAMLAQHRLFTVREVQQAAATQLETQLQHRRALARNAQALLVEAAEIADVHEQGATDLEKVDLSDTLAVAEPPTQPVTARELIERHHVEQVRLVGDPPQDGVETHRSFTRSARGGPKCPPYKSRGPEYNTARTFPRNLHPLHRNRSARVSNETGFSGSACTACHNGPDGGGRGLRLCVGCGVRATSGSGYGQPFWRGPASARRNCRDRAKA